ncbi:MAG: hypothetical protein ABR974_10610 [Bacteroidales bacterium]|jgi:hypothetical protein
MKKLRLKTRFVFKAGELNKPRWMTDLCNWQLNEGIEMFKQSFGGTDNFYWSVTKSTVRRTRALINIILPAYIKGPQNWINEKDKLHPKNKRKELIFWTKKVIRALKLYDTSLSLKKASVKLQAMLDQI